MMNTFQVGDKVHFSVGSDTFPGTVTKVAHTLVTVRQDAFHRDPEWKPDFHPGGFVGHVANNDEQVNVISADPEGYVWKFTRRAVPKMIREYHRMSEEQSAEKVRYIATGGDWKNGTMLYPGWAAHYDYNL